MEANEKAISELFDLDKEHSFVVPQYQRNYSWRREQWEKLFYDITVSDGGHFFGSFICICMPKTDSTTPTRFELVDGQQRFTTISILICSIYERLSKFKDVGDDVLTAGRVNLRNSLFINDEPGKSRYTPTEQSDNKADFEHILWSSFGETYMPGCAERPKNFGNRLIAKCKKYMDEQVSKFETLDEVKKFYSKLNKSSLIMVVGQNYSQAYVLFETLNNRGIPLSVMDLVKSKLFQKLDADEEDLSVIFDQWKTLIDYIPEANIQERFLRHFYNALKDVCVPEVSKKPQATGATMISIYEDIIDNDPRQLF